jgi:glycosyltransferase involved in cell wall biosynthesis
MGGYYYISRGWKKIKVYLSRTGVGFIDELKYVKPIRERLIKRIAAKQRYDVVHLNSTEALSQLSGVKIPKLFVLHGSPDYADKQTCKMLEDVYSKVDAFVVVSRHAAYMLREKCGFEPTHVIHHGVDVELFNPLSYAKDHARATLGLPQDKKIILWNARLSPEKKLETLIYALPKVVKEFKDVVVIVKTRAVVKDHEAKIRSIIRKLKLGAHVIFDKGWAPWVKMPMYYRASDLYINTSVTEAFGSPTMLEAMACGIPTIANNASSNPEALGNGGLLYDKDDSFDLGEKILKVLTDERLSMLLSYKASRRVFEELTFQKISEKYVNYITLWYIKALVKVITSLFSAKTIQFQTQYCDRFRH